MKDRRSTRHRGGKRSPSQKNDSPTEAKNKNTTRKPVSVYDSGLGISDADVTDVERHRAESKKALLSSSSGSSGSTDTTSSDEDDCPDTMRVGTRKAGGGKKDIANDNKVNRKRKRSLEDEILDFKHNILSTTKLTKARIKEQPGLLKRFFQFIGVSKYEDADFDDKQNRARMTGHNVELSEMNSAGKFNSASAKGKGKKNKGKGKGAKRIKLTEDAIRRIEAKGSGKKGGKSEFLLNMLRQNQQNNNLTNAPTNVEISPQSPSMLSHNENPLLSCNEDEVAWKNNAEYFKIWSDIASSAGKSNNEDLTIDNINDLYTSADDNISATDVSVARTDNTNGSINAKTNNLSDCDLPPDIEKIVDNLVVDPISGEIFFMEQTDLKRSNSGSDSSYVHESDYTVDYSNENSGSGSNFGSGGSNFNSGSGSNNGEPNRDDYVLDFIG